MLIGRLATGEQAAFSGCEYKSRGQTAAVDAIVLKQLRELSDCFATKKLRVQTGEMSVPHAFIRQPVAGLNLFS
jgi:hypothetical protein